MISVTQSSIKGFTRIDSDDNSIKDTIGLSYDSFPDMLAICDDKWKVVFANKALLGFLEVELSQTFRKAIHSLLPHCDSLKKEGCFQHQGRWIDFSVKDVIIEGRIFNGIFMHLISSAAIDEIKSSPLTQQKSELYTKNKFVATVSHEMRTPLNAIVGFADLLSEGNFKPTQVENYSKLILKNAEILLSLVNDILDFSKLSSHQYIKRLESFSLNELARTIHSSFQKMAEDKGLEFYLWIKTSDQIVFSDPHILRQIIINLIGNAIKFTDFGSVILTIDRHEKTAIISVKDTGVGIEKNKIKELFMEFHQIDSGNGRYYEGTGLGLSIVKRFIDLLGGEIKVESAVGSGSLFTVKVPVEAA